MPRCMTAGFLSRLVASGSATTTEPAAVSPAAPILVVVGYGEGAAPRGQEDEGKKGLGAIIETPLIVD